MVKSHVDCSPDLTWALVQKQNVFVRRSRSATRQKTHRSFSAETNNLMSLHTYKHSGLAHAGVGIKGVADKNPTAAVMTVGDKATSVKGIFQQQAKTVANLCAAARPDLTVDALKKIAAVARAGRSAKALAK
uniref:Ribosomal eL28/Mak16 domain-containing protein n=1 Tax=Micromonas pusilla TaxID=38833 RepID=A0A7S0DB73_MICPS